MHPQHSEKSLLYIVKENAREVGGVRRHTFTNFCENTEVKFQPLSDPRDTFSISAVSYSIFLLTFYRRWCHF